MRELVRLGRVRPPRVACAGGADYCAPQYRLSAVLLIVSLASPHRTITA